MDATQYDKVDFHYVDTSFRIEDASRYQAWVYKIADAHGASIDAVNYIICSDTHILEINNTYLSHDYYTDIITFPYKQGARLESDIFISIDTVRSNAEGLGLDSHDELLRVMSHGILHLIGYGDKTEEERTEMRKQEERCMAMF